jgi:hypothetical protein
MTRREETYAGPEANPTLVEAIAQRVAELLLSELGLAERLLTPSEVADRFAVSRTWVYEHATELGAIRLGKGPKARLRFHPKTVALDPDGPLVQVRGFYGPLQCAQHPPEEAPNGTSYCIASAPRPPARTNRARE